MQTSQPRFYFIPLLNIFSLELLIGLQSLLTIKGHEIGIRTLANHSVSLNSFDVLKGNRTWISFKVIECGCHTIDMGTDSSAVYEVMLGCWHDTTSEIRRKMDGRILDQYAAPVLNRCGYRFTEFWIGWENGVIEVGRGLTYGGRLLLRHNEPNPYVINSIAIETQRDGRWVFYIGDEGFYTLISPDKGMQWEIEKEFRGVGSPTECAVKARAAPMSFAFRFSPGFECQLLRRKVNGTLVIHTALWVKL